ncbi:hypothetical protein ACWEQL_33725 [Kitasatospora sp. NPDC004240]
MKQFVSMVAAALVAFVVFVAVRDHVDIDLGSSSDNHSSSSSSGGGSGGNGSNDSGSNGSNGSNGNSNGNNGKSGGGSSPTVTSRPAEVLGSVQTTFRGTKGSERVDCSAIDTEFKVFPYKGKIRWTILVRDARPGAAPPYPGSTPPGIVVSPGSGTLEDGQSQLVHLRGRFDGPGKRFWVLVTAPTSSGSSGSSGSILEFSCY